jgi:hypothetical protein
VNEIRGVIYNTTTRTFGTDTLIASNLNSLYRYDAAEYINSVGWYLMYRSTTPSIIFAYMNGLSITSSASLGEDADTGSVAVWASSDTNLLWMAWANTATGTRATVRSSVTLGTVVVAPTTMDGDPTNNLARMLTWAKGTGSWNILIWTVTAEGPTGYARPRSKFRALSTAGTKGNQQQCSDVCLISKGLSAANGYTYAAFLYDASDNNNTDVPYLRSGGNQIAFTMEVVDTTNAATGYASNSWRVAAVWALGEAGRERAPCTLSAFRSVLVNPSDGTLEHWFMLSPEYDQILIVDSNYAAGHPGVDLCRQRITPFPPIYAARIGKNVVFSGGVPQVWDGVSLNEYGFHYPPENSKMLDGGTVGTGLNAGLYGVQMTWEYRHATGDTARSAPTFALVAPLHSSLTLAAVNHKITVTLPTLGNSRKFNDTSAAEGLIVRAYRTEANGTVYHAEGDFASPSGFASNGSGPGALLTVTVQQPDATIETHPEIYTTDDLLSNFPPPALAYIHTHRNRLFGIMAERRTSVAFSHTYEDGELPGWHPDLVIDVPDECVALATIDEKLMILCKGGIYLISGNGPDRKGLNSDYDQPFRLNSPHGCISAASVRNFPSGIMYQSPTGFCLIDRQTNVTRVGGPVEDVLASFPFVHASCTIKDREWIYWSVLDRQYLESVSAGRVVAYDWRHNVWSVDQVPFVAGDDSHMVLSYVTSLATRGLDTFMTIQADPAVYKHTGSADPGPNWIYTYLRTAMLNLGSNSKFQRARWLTLLGQLKFVHQLALTVTTYHHATSAGLIQFFVWTYAQMSALQNYALKMHLQNQVGSFLQIELADGPDASAPTGYVDSAQWVTLLLEIGLKRGTMQSADAGME